MGLTIIRDAAPRPRGSLLALGSLSFWITLPRVSSDLLIAAPSRSRSPTVPAFFERSEPARSTSESVAMRTRRARLSDESSETALPLSASPASAGASESAHSMTTRTIT